MSERDETEARDEEVDDLYARLDTLTAENARLRDQLAKTPAPVAPDAVAPEPPFVLDNLLAVQAAAKRPAPERTWQEERAAAAAHLDHLESTIDNDVSPQFALATARADIKRGAHIPPANERGGRDHG
jgi:hypothetical protein